MPPAADIPATESPAKALGLVGLYLFVSLAVMFTAQCSVGILAVVLAGPANAADLTVLPLGFLAAGTIAGISGIALLAIAAAVVLGRPLRSEFALNGPPLRLALLSLVGGLVAGLFPGWIVSFLSDTLPLWMQLGALDSIGEALERGSPLARWGMVFAVTVVAPIGEELVFRGFIWRTLERAFPPLAVWLITSVLFGLYHIDPVQGLAVIVTGLFLGWMRLTSRSLWPAMIAHSANNSLAAVAILTATGSETQESLTFLQALLPLAITVALCGVAWRLRVPSTGHTSGD